MADHSSAFRQRVLRVDPSGRDVPLALWTPIDVTGQLPLVLIGHGAGGHKLDESRLDLAARYTSRGVAAAAIDGPWHGERGLPDGRLVRLERCDPRLDDRRLARVSRRAAASLSLTPSAS